MTDLYNIIETFAGTPGTDPFMQIIIYTASTVFALLLFLAIIDIMYQFARSIKA